LLDDPLEPGLPQIFLGILEDVCMHQCAIDGVGLGAHDCRHRGGLHPLPALERPNGFDTFLSTLITALAPR